MLIWFCLSENETLGQFVPLDPNLGQFNGFCGQALAVDIFFSSSNKRQLMSSHINMKWIIISLFSWK